jgi:hypothetical protein
MHRRLCYVMHPPLRPLMPMILMTTVSLRVTLLGCTSILNNQLIERVVLVPVNLCIAKLLGRLIHNCILKRSLNPIPSDDPILIAFSECSFREPVVSILIMMPITTVRV